MGLLLLIYLRPGSRPILQLVAVTPHRELVLLACNCRVEQISERSILPSEVFAFNLQLVPLTGSVMWIHKSFFPPFAVLVSPKVVFTKVLTFCNII